MGREAKVFAHICAFILSIFLTCYFLFEVGPNRDLWLQVAISLSVILLEGLFCVGTATCLGELADRD